MAIPHFCSAFFKHFKSKGHSTSCENGRGLPRGLSWSLKFFFILLFFFSLGRLLILLMNPEYFHDLPAYQTAHAFLNGLRFDISIMLVFLGLPVFLLQLPIKSKWYFRIIASIAVAEGYLLIFTLAGDVGNFSQIHSHLTDQLAFIMEDFHYLLKTAAINYWYLFWPVQFFLIFGLWRTWRYAQRPPAIWPLKKTIPQILIIMICLYWGIFGQIGISLRQVLSPSNAFYYPSLAYGNLTLNGPFSFFAYLRYARKGQQYRPELDQEKATEVVHRHLLYDGLTIPNKDYPLSFKIEKFYGPDLTTRTKHPNILLILVESLDASFLEAFQAWMENPYQADHAPVPAELSANLSAMAKAGVRFSNFHSNAWKSNLSITSVVASMAPFYFLPYLGHGIETSTLMRVGDIFQAQGYHTFFAQASVRQYFRMDFAMRAFGFQDYFGKEDYPPLFKAKGTDNGWDAELFHFLGHDYLPTVQRPFMGIVFTGTTHVPYLLPDESFIKVRPHSQSKINGFYNTLYYLDQAFGEFMATIKKQPWFEDTVIVLTGDHTNNRKVDHQAKLPLVIYAPAFLKPQVVSTLGSQSDIFPTLFDMLRWPQTYSGFGRSIFAPGKKFVIGQVNDTMNTLIDGKGEKLLSRNLQGITYSNLTPEEEKEWDLFGRSLQQTFYTCDKANRITLPAAYQADFTKQR